METISKEKTYSEEVQNLKYQDLARYITHLELSETRFHNIISDYVDGIAVLDKNRIVRFVNSAFEDIINLDSHNLLGNKFDFKISEGKTIEMEFHHSNGLRIIAEICTTRTTWDGKPAYLVSLKDITQRKRLKVIEERQQQEKTFQFLGSTLGVDLNRYISKVAHALDSIPEQITLKELNIILHHINSSTIHCLILAKQLIFLGHCHRLSCASINLNKLIEEMVPRIKGLIMDKVTIEFDLTFKGATIHADSEQIKHLILNMVILLLKSPKAPKSLLIRTEITRLFGLGEESPKTILNTENAISLTIQNGRHRTKNLWFQSFRDGLVINTNEELAKQVMNQIVRKHGGELEICNNDSNQLIALQIIMPLKRSTKGDERIDPKTEIDIVDLFESAFVNRNPPTHYL